MIVTKPKFDSLLKRFYLVLDCSGAYTVGLSRYQPRCLGSPHHIEARTLIVPYELNYVFVHRL